MKTTSNTIIVFILLISIFYIVFLQMDFGKHEKAKSFPPQIFKPSIDHLLEKRGLPVESILNYRESQLQAMKQQHSYRNGQANFPGSWEVQGPGNIGGRITCIALDPKNDEIIFAGFTEGGLWKTTDKGKNWKPIFDDQTMLSIGCIAIDPKNSNVIYVGTGDPNNGAYITAGNGIYKSTDGGLSWKLSGLQLCRNISKIIIDANNSNIITVAALGNPFEKNEHRGIFKSLNGGNTWAKTLFISNGTGIIDLIVDPSNPNIMYCSSYDRWLSNSSYAYGGPNSAVYKSTNKGESWSKLQNALQPGIWGRINLTISANNPNVIYLSYIKYDTINPSGTYELGGIRVSSDKGMSWKETEALNLNSGLEPDCLRGFGWYFGRVIANPKNEKDIFLLGVDLWRSLDGGDTWAMDAPEWWTYDVHADKHELVFMKDNSILLGTDGGIYRREELSEDWVDFENIPSTQLYRVTHVDQYPDLYFGGAQDNGTMSGNKNEFDDWQRLFGGDGFQLQARKSIPDQMYAETQNGSIWDMQTYERITDDLPGTKNWDMPYFISQHADHIMIAGTDHVYETDLELIYWDTVSNKLTANGRYTTRRTPNITGLDESSLDPNILIAGTTNGLVWKRTTAGQMQWNNISANLPQGYITSVKCSKTNKDIFYATLSTKVIHDYSPFVYKTTNGGQHWEPIQSNLPMFPVYDLFIYPNRGDSILFVATDIGVYATIDAGESWQRMGDNMPFIPVFDLDLNTKYNQLIAATYARSIQTFNLDKLIRTLPVGNKDNLSYEGIKVYPNPFFNQLNIIVDKKAFAKLKGAVVNINGIKILDFELPESGKLQLNTIDILKGSYYLIIEDKLIGRIIKM